jgi:uncharacterized protein (UPF0332 family)
MPAAIKNYRTPKDAMIINPYKEKSDEAWEDGVNFLKIGRANAAANRMYYATFQAIKGHFVVKGKMATNEKDNVHAKILNLICPTNERNKKWNYRKKVNELLQQRITADYEVESVESITLQNLIVEVNAIRNEYLKPQDN